MGLAGFDFQALNRKYLAQPANVLMHDNTRRWPALRLIQSWHAMGCIRFHLCPIWGDMFCKLELRQADDIYHNQGNDGSRELADCRSRICNTWQVASCLI